MVRTRAVEAMEWTLACRAPSEQGQTPAASMSEAGRAQAQHGLGQLPDLGLLISKRYMSCRWLLGWR